MPRVGGLVSYRCESLVFKNSILQYGVVSLACLMQKS